MQPIKLKYIPNSRKYFFRKIEKKNIEMGKGIESEKFKRNRNGQIPYSKTLEGMWQKQYTWEILREMVTKIDVDSLSIIFIKSK